MGRPTARGGQEKASPGKKTEKEQLAGSVWDVDGRPRFPRPLWPPQPLLSSRTLSHLHATSECLDRGLVFVWLRCWARLWTAAPAQSLLSARALSGKRVRGEAFLWLRWAGSL